MSFTTIYTGYYANLRRYLAAGCAPIGISVGTPKYLQGSGLLQFVKRLAPRYDMLRIEDEDEYTRRYKSEVLGRLDYRSVIAEIEALAKSCGKQSAVLLCYEKPPKFCHRSLVAEWINARGEFYVREFGYEGEEAAAKPPRIFQMDMFSSLGTEAQREKTITQIDRRLME